MTYEEFLKFVPTQCIYETIYEDTEGRPILVISLLDAYGMVNKAADELRRLHHNSLVLLTNALWKACGDDEDLVNATIESQGG